MKKRILKLISFAFITTMALTFSNQAQIFADAQPLMQKALGHLTKAKSFTDVKEIKKELIHAKRSLERAAHNKGGHRVKAISEINKALRLKDIPSINALIDSAIKEIQEGMKFADEKKKK